MRLSPVFRAVLDGLPFCVGLQWKGQWVGPVSECLEIKPLLPGSDGRLSAVNPTTNQNYIQGA